MRSVILAASCIASLALAGCSEAPSAGTARLESVLANGVSAADSVRLRLADRSRRELNLSTRQQTEAPEAASLANQSCQVEADVPGVVSGCDDVAPAVVPLSPYLFHSGAPRDEGEIEYRGQIEINFGSPRASIRVEGYGALKCTGTAVQVIGYLEDAEVFRVSSSFIDPDDCGEDDITFGVTAASPTALAADRIVIVGPTPWTFEVFGEPGRAQLRYVLTYAPPPQELRASCSPTPVERGQTVRCTARLLSPAPFRIVKRLAEGDQKIRVEDLTPTSIGQSAEAVWEGEAVVSTSVQFTAEVQVGAAVQKYVSRKVRYEVLPRTWPAWQFTNRLGVSYFLYTKMTPFISPGSLLGAFQPTSPDEASVLALFSRAQAGPNSGAVYLGQPYVFSDYDIVIHPALNIAAYPSSGTGYSDAAAWNADQNGFGAGTCLQGSIPVLRSEVERHEGVTGSANSHFGVGNQAFTSLQPQQRLEALASVRSDPEFLRIVNNKVADVFNKGAYRSAQDTFDRNDIPLIFAAANCTWDFNRFDP